MKLMKKADYAHISGMLTDIISFTEKPITMETKNTTYTISTLNWPERQFITKRTTVPFNKLSDFFKENYGAIYSFIGQAGLRSDGMPCAFYYKIDEVKNETDMAAAVAVQGNVPDAAALEKVVLPASKVITTTHIGSYDTMVPAYQAMDQYLAENGLKKELMIEEYLSDPMIDKDPAKWKTNIYFLVK